MRWGAIPRSTTADGEPRHKKYYGGIMLLDLDNPFKGSSVFAAMPLLAPL